MCTDLSWLDSRRQWAGLRAVVMAKEKRVVGGGESNDVRYFLTSLENIETVKKAIRRHWGIENRLHWCLDVFFGEDGKRHRKDHCPENMTVMRRIALNLLRAPEKPENKKKDNLSKRKVWFRANRKFREAVLRQLKKKQNFTNRGRCFTCGCPDDTTARKFSLKYCVRLCYSHLLSICCHVCFIGDLILYII